MKPSELYDLLMEMKAAGANDAAIAMTAIRELEPTGSAARQRRYRHRKRNESVPTVASTIRSRECRERRADSHKKILENLDTVWETKQ